MADPREPGGAPPPTPDPPPGPPPGGDPEHFSPFPTAAAERRMEEERLAPGSRPPGEALPPPAAPRAGRTGPGRRPEEIHDRLTLLVVRALFFFTAVGIGGYCASLFRLDPLVSIGAAGALALVVIFGEVFFSKAPVRTMAAITFGLIIGLTLSAVLQPAIELMVQAIAPPGFAIHESERLVGFLQLIAITIFCYFGVTVLLQTRDDFKFIIPYVEFRKEVKGRSPLILDTSAIIDGRIAALLATGALDQRVSVPRFVLDELQAIADSPDRGRRERGRRGMDMLEELRREHRAEVLEGELPPGAEVDAALLDLAAVGGGRLVTTDFNLQKRARLQGVWVLNLNDLASALKPAIVPGETLQVRLLRPGEDPGQAVGFLSDGTMVVVENASRRIGQEVSVEVTSAIQTSAGKMVFGRTRRPPGEPDRPPAAERRREGQRTGRRGPPPGPPRAGRGGPRPEPPPPSSWGEPPAGEGSMDAARDVAAVVPAAGAGLRFGGRKAFLELAGKPLVLHSLIAFASVEEVREVVVAVPAEDLGPSRERVRGWLPEIAAASRGREPPRVEVLAGGVRRQDSVEAGLAAVSAGARWVLVHDAARPLILPSDIRRVIRAVRETGAAVLGHPATDSVKEERDRRVVRDLPRERVWLVQTPQGASADLLRRAYQEARSAGREATDETGLLTAAGVEVTLVEGSRANIKVTFPDDLRWAELLLRARSMGGEAP